MKQHQETLSIVTRGRGFYEITEHIEAAVRKSGVAQGLCVVFCRHTSASLILFENADSTARKDLEAWLQRLAPDGDPKYVHRTEGPDDMAAHLRSVLTRTSESIPVNNRHLGLGTWQGLFLVEHRTAPHNRELIVHVMGL